MNCTWSEERFERFLDGELNARERRCLRTHVDACDACRGLLAELRVVDALLLEPRAVALAPNFTFATMDEVRALPPPAAARRSPAAAYLVCYLLAAWSLLAVAFVLTPQWLRAAGAAATHLGHDAAMSTGAVGHVIARIGERGEMSWWTTFVAGVLLLDVVLALALAGALRVARPLLSERLRS